MGWNIVYNADIQQYINYIKKVNNNCPKNILLQKIET